MRRRRLPARYVRTQCVQPSWCLDCGRNTTPCTISRRRGTRACPVHRGWEFYALDRDLWQRAVPEDADAPSMTVFLCIGCLEVRLGRRLTPSDFPAVSLNTDSTTESPRLANRKGHRP